MQLSSDRHEKLNGLEKEKDEGLTLPDFQVLL